jgi:hypothetical protein
MVRLKAVPLPNPIQGLKPDSFWDFNGTAEAVPFPNLIQCLKPDS